MVAVYSSALISDPRCTVASRKAASEMARWAGSEVAAAEGPADGGGPLDWSAASSSTT